MTMSAIFQAPEIIKRRLETSDKSSLLGQLAYSGQLDKFLNSLTTKEELNEVLYGWHWWGRPAQLPPGGQWTTWIIEAGRGFGKTRPGAEWVIEKAKTHPTCRIGLGGPTPDDYRDTMVEGVSGILACSPPNFRPRWIPTQRALYWPNRSKATCFSGETPDKLRGPQHHFFWTDELTKFKKPQEFIDQVYFGLRLGPNPQHLVTTTPKPLKPYLRLRNRDNTVITGGSTYENLNNLSPVFQKEILSVYEGTRLGRQELMAEILLDVQGALWSRDVIDETRVDKFPQLTRIAIAVDPAVSAEEDSAETGMVAGGIDANRHGYLMDDQSGRYTPAQWGRKAVRMFVNHKADVIIAEKNQGGDMVKYTIETAAKELSREWNKEIIVPVHLVTASKGKIARAEPVAALGEQGRLHHYGTFGPLEDQLCTWLPGEASPDRLDAYVWLFWGLLLDAPLTPGVFII